MKKGTPSVVKVSLTTLLVSIMVFQLIIFTNFQVNAASNITSDANSYYLENTKIKVSINKTTGFIDTVTNKLTGAVNKKANSGSWPFKIMMSNNTTAEITSSTANIISSSNISTSGSDEVLQIVYNNLVTNQSSPSNTNIKAIVTYQFNSADSYFKFNVQFVNNSTTDINLITLCEGGSLVTGESSSKLVIPIWGEVAFWNDPINQWGSYNVSNPRIMAYPAKGWNDLEMGFMDYSGAKGGIGVAYINKQQTLMNFKVGTDSGGMSFAPSLLSTKIKSIITPVKPGESINTDNVVVAAHIGDWHAMADIYRFEYNEAFTINGKPDYLTWETISPFVKQTDFGFRYYEMPFSQVFTDVKAKLSEWGDLVSANQLMVWYTGQNAHGYGHDTPTMLPASTVLGGTAGLLKLSNDLHSIGANIYHYEHPFAFATDSTDYPTIASSNPNQSSAEWDGVNHYYVIITNEVMNLWKNKLIPEISTTKPDGLQFDQGSLQFTVDINGNAVSRLSQHTKALVQLSQYTRNNLNAGKTSYIVSEGFSDLTGRYIDMAQTRWDKAEAPINDGDLILGGRQYVHPQFVSMYNSAEMLNSGIWKNMRQYVAIIGGICNLNEGEDYGIGNDTEYLWFKQQMRAINAPGYPYNYRDNVGIGSSNSNLWVRTFTSGDRATITFWANGKTITDGVVTLNPSALGLSGKQIDFKFDLERSKTGYIIYDSKSGKIEKTSVVIKNQPIPTTIIKSSTHTSSGGTVSNSNAITSTDVNSVDSYIESNSEQNSADSSSSNDSNSSASNNPIQKKSSTNLILIVSIIAIAILLVAFVLFVIVTEEPKALYKFLFGKIKRK